MSAVTHWTAQQQKCVPAAAAGVTVTPSGTAFNNSSWVQVTSGIGHNIAICAIVVNNNNITADYRIDLGKGAASSETVIGTVTNHVEAGAGGNVCEFRPPILLNANTRLAVRMRKSGTSTTTWSFKVVYFEFPDPFFEADLTALSTMTAAVKVDRNLDVDMAALCTMTAALKPNRNVEADLTALCTMAVRIQVERRIQAALSATADMLCALTVIDAVTEFEADLTADCNMTAEFDVLRRIQAALSATCTMAVDLDFTRRIQAALTATAALTAAVSVDRRLVAALAATADLLVRLKVERPLEADLTADANFNATVEFSRCFEALLTATADLTAQHHVDRNVAADLQADAMPALFLRVDRPLQATLEVTALPDTDLTLAHLVVFSPRFQAWIVPGLGIRYQVPGFPAGWIPREFGTVWNIPG